MITFCNLSVLSLVYCYVMLFYLKHRRLYLKLLVHFIRKLGVSFWEQLI